MWPFNTDKLLKDCPNKPSKDTSGEEESVAAGSHIKEQSRIYTPLSGSSIPMAEEILKIIKYKAEPAVTRDEVTSLHELSQRALPFLSLEPYPAVQLLSTLFYQCKATALTAIGNEAMHKAGKEHLREKLRDAHGE